MTYKIKIIIEAIIETESQLENINKIYKSVARHIKEKGGRHT